MVASCKNLEYTLTYLCVAVVSVYQLGYFGLDRYSITVVKAQLFKQTVLYCVFVCSPPASPFLLAVIA